MLGSAVVVLALVVTVLVARRPADSGDGLAGTASVSASSSALGSSPRNAVTTSRAQQRVHGWTSGAETVGAWIELSWREPVDVRRVTLERNALGSPGMLAGYLSFGDGSDVQVQLSTTSATTLVPVAVRKVDRLRFTVTRVADGARNVSLLGLRVGDRQEPGDVSTDAPADGNVARSAAISTSEPLDGQAAELTDGNAAGRDPGSSAGVTLKGPGWIQLDWAEPRELTTVALAGGGGTGARSGDLVFSDGSSLKIGAVLDDPLRPSVTSFMPRVSRSLRVDLDPGAASDAITITELSAYVRSAPPATFAGAGTATAPDPTAPACDASASRPSDGLGVVVRCPAVGSVVDSTVTVQVAAGPSYTLVSATVWGGPSAVDVTARSPVAADGSAELNLDLAAVPAGPFVVQLRASGPRRIERTVLLQLYRSGDVRGDAAVDDPTPPGRSLVFDEEFDRPISVSRTGAGADYTAAKPEATGVSQFGDAPFADPADAAEEGPSVVGDDLLRLPVAPAPGGGRTGALVASARPGGSGFSAQYGYFEARMMAPAAPGTWPAFWMLPTPNLVQAEPAVVEVDAVELYGHNPVGACHSTHEYVGGKDGGVARCGTRWATTRDAAGWHVYGVAVAPTLISFYIDGELVATAPQVQGGDEPLFFLLDLALGGGWPVDLSRVQGRAQLYVDYVRVYV